MKPSFVPWGAALALSLAFSAPAFGAEEPLKITGPHVHENLAIFLIHGEDRATGKNWLTLQEALEKKKAVVRETSNVNELIIENTGDDTTIYVEAGDIVKGGKQDRCIGNDLVIESGVKTPVGAFCVEHGRWTRRGSESAAYFASANDRAPSKQLKLAVKQMRAQG